MKLKRATTKPDRKENQIAEEVSLNADTPVEIQTRAIHAGIVYASIGLGVGVLCIVGGIALFAWGVGGHTTWTADVLGFRTELTDAAPGAVLVVVGLCVVFITRLRIKTTKFIPRSGNEPREED